MWVLALLACKGDDLDTGDVFTFDAPEATPDLRGPGGPAVTFTEDQLWQNCAVLSGDPEEEWWHHNEVMPFRGHLVMPWSPEFGSGGLSLFEMDEPCSPVKVGEGHDSFMRETHSMGFVHLREGDPHAGDYVVVTGNLGIQIWDLSDLANPEVASYLQLEGVFYPDSYARVVLSVVWQYPYVFVAGADNGVYVVDATDPTAPEMIAQYTFDPVLRAGGVFVIGNTMLVSSAEGRTAAILDVSDPEDPVPYPGGEFELYTADGEGPWEAYHASVSGNMALFARKEGGGGIIAYDWSDPENPTYLGDVHTDDGNGGYAYYDEGYGFLGDSHFARVFDMRDLDNIVMIGEGDLPGDLDTLTPYGNVAILSVDDDAENDEASAVMPWSLDPDIAGPIPTRVDPADGATGIATSARIGVGFNEFIEPSSVFAGSIQLFDEDGRGVDGWGSATESTAGYSPKTPLDPGTTYTVEVLAGGITDLNGNAVEQGLSTTFTTAGGR